MIEGQLGKKKNNDTISENMNEERKEANVFFW